MAVRKYSRKRDAILECVRSTTEHPAAEWVYSHLKDEFPDLSLATVYRNLAMFKDEGLVESLGTVDGIERFDGNTAPHDHFICTACNAVIDFEDPALPDALLEQVQTQLGAKLSGYRLRYYGLCRSCKNKKFN